MTNKRMVMGLVALLAAHPANAQTESGPATRAQTPNAAQQESVPHEQVREINIAVGENYTLPAEGVRSYSLGSEGMAELNLTPDNRKFVIVGKAPGSTTLLLLKAGAEQVHYTLNVFKRPLKVVEAELLDLLRGTPGIRVKQVGARFFVEGGVSTEPELARLQHIAGLFPGQVESLVVLGGAAADRKINVRVDFFFVQLDRSRGYQLGVAYPGRIGGPGIASLEASYDFLNGSFSTAAASVVSQPLPGLDLAASRGYAKVLKHSTVITANGSEASFSSGGEQNFVVTSGLSASMTALPFGTDVTVLPRFDPGTRELEIRLAAQVSDLTAPVTSGTDVPGRDVSSLKTLVSLKLGQSIVLSGIRTRAQRHSTQGLPVLSQIPVLGALFGSHGDAEHEVEGMILIVPSVVESIPKGAQEILDEAIGQYLQFDGDTQDLTLWENAR